MALEKSTFEQKFFAVDLDEIHRTGRSACRAEEMDFHRGKKTRRSRKVECNPAAGYKTFCWFNNLRCKSWNSSSQNWLRSWLILCLLFGATDMDRIRLTRVGL